MIAKDYVKGSKNFRLAWKFTISSFIPDNEQWIYVDALSGEVIGNTPLIYDVNTPGTAQTIYSQTIGMICDSYPSGFRLSEARNTTPGHSVNIHTWNCLSQPIYTNASEFSNSNTNWITGSWPAISQDQAALDAHWGEEMILDYWSTVRQRNSLNNLGLDIIGYVHYYDANSTAGWPNNAQWDGSYHVMRYGNGDGVTFNPLTALDVVAHEMGHGINQFTANLHSATNNQESDALNEGFSDIWGASIENWATPNKQTWLIGGEIFKTSTYNCIRNLQNPKSTTAAEGQHPNTYHGSYWDYNGEPHTNSTVLSHWFYLLSQGGIGTNDITNTYSVYGIGINIAQLIVYNTETSYLNSSANYTDVRNSTIQAATDLYGANSLEVMQVQNAWYAVGLGTKPSQITITGPATVCSTGATFTLNSVPSSCSVNWTYSSNLIYVSGQGTNQLVVKAGVGVGPSLLFLTTSENYGSSGLIRATITDAYGNVIIEKTPWVGLPDYTPIVNGSSTMFCSQSLYVEKYNRNATWSVYGPLQVIGANYGYKCTVKGTESGVGWVYATNSNLCGSFRGEKLVQVTCSSYSVFPNPTNSEVTISLLADNSIDGSFQKNKSIKSIRVVDKSGITLSTQKYGSETFETKIDLSKFTSGVYIIKINEGPYEESYTIVKQ